MLTLKKIAVTGGLATGKSTVCELLRKQGAYVVNADAIVHELLKPESVVYQQVIQLLGPDIFTGNQIDRAKISNIVFSNPTKLKALESILHPAVRQEIKRQFEAVKTMPSYYWFVAEVPLLYEAHMEDDFDLVVAVVSDKEIARKRALSTDEFDRRSRLQLSQTAKEKRADYVIANNGNLQQLQHDVAYFIRSLNET